MRQVDGCLQGVCLLCQLHVANWRFSVGDVLCQLVEPGWQLSVSCMLQVGGYLSATRGRTAVVCQLYEGG